MREDSLQKLRVLSLDGGDARCMSQLEILREFMHRLNIDTGIEHRPCDYFHWIGGVGAGGVVATLLVKLTMSADEASVAFAQICSSVLSDDQCSPVERTSKLEAIMNKILKETNLSPETKLLDEANASTGCKLGLFYMAAVNMSRCGLFRNYECRQTSYNPTIVEAIRVVWANPGLFPSVSIGTGIVQEELVSATSGFNNPTLEVLKEVHQAFGPDATVSCLLSLGAGRAPIRSMMIDVTAIPKALEQLAMDCEKTADEVERRIGRLGVYFRFSVDRGLEFDTPSSPMGSITAHTGQYLLDVGVNKNLDSCIRSCEKESRVTLEQLYHARTKIPTSLRGLPPLTAFFVPRPEPMKALIKNLVENKSSEQHIVVLAGMGGSGKTQLALKFARDFEERFQPIMFIDASSIDTIKKGLLMRVRALGRDYAPDTIEECLEILADPEDPLVRDWLIIYDNADDPQLDLRPFIPTCDNGAVLITTRNTMLRDLAPEGYLELDVMSEEESITVLLQAALPSGVKPTTRDRSVAATIAQQLGYLPIAIVQAGCFIRQQQCLYEYEDRLKKNRKTTLERPARNQRDTLKYGHSVYAALNITLEALSQGARHLLSLLSSVHFANFPRRLIAVAAKSGFSFEITELLDRPASFQTTIHLLKQIFCPTGTWDENVLTNSLEELQQYSLVSLVPSASSVTFRLHPLVHGWAQDLLSPEDQEVYRAGAIRLVASAAGRENTALYDYLTSHIMSFFDTCPSLHVNDRIAFLRILDEDQDSGDTAFILEMAQKIYEEVKGAVGESDIRTLRAALFLGGAHGTNGDIPTMEKMETEVVNACELLLGREDLETVEAIFQLSGTYHTQKRYNEAEKLLEEVIKLRGKKLGEGNVQTAEAMEIMAGVYKAQGRYAEAQKMLEIALSTRQRLLGRADILTAFTMMHLADTLDYQENHTEANALRQEALTLESTHLGTLHLGTLWTTVWMAHAYTFQKRFDEAEKLLEQALSGMKESQGAQATETFEIMGYLADVYDKQERFVEAESLKQEELSSRREIQGDSALETLDCLQWFVCFYLEHGRAEDMLKIAKELVEGRISVLGEENLDTIIAYSFLGRAYQDLKQFHQAEEVRRHELELRKKVLGYEHPGTFAVIGAIAQIAFDQGRQAEAETLWGEEIVGRKRLLGDKQDAALLNAIESLSVLTFSQKRYEETESMAKEILIGRRKLLGEEDISTLRSFQWLGRIYTEQRKFPEAEEIWDELLPKQKKVIGEDDPETLNSYFWIGRSRFDQARWVDAEAIWSELHQRRKSVLGEKHIDTLLMIQWLSVCASRQGRMSDAVSLDEMDVALMTEALGPKDTTVYEAMERLITSYQMAERLGDAENVARKMVEIGEVNLGLLDVWTIRSRATLGYILHCQGRISESVTLIQQVLKERIDLFGESNIMVARSKSRLATAYEVLGRYDEAKALAEEAVIIQRKELPADNAMLKETLEVLQKLESPPAAEDKHPSEPVASDQPSEIPSQPVIVSPIDRKRPIREDSIDIDGHHSPGNDPQQTLAPPHFIARPASPFEQRKKFGRSPNPWSMFM